MPGFTETIAFSELPGVDRRTINGKLEPARNGTMLALIGNPRGTYDQECRAPTNPRIADMMETADFGPFRATGLAPAVARLKVILADVMRELPEVHAALGTAGMMCCRLVRGSTTSISDHSWGTAIDLTLGGKLDKRGDDRCQRGLLAMAPIFNRHGFYWGAAFPTEDSMHFEASEGLINEWAKEGLFGPVPPSVDIGIMTIGDRSAVVEELQRRLNLKLAVDINVDGIFGKDTRAAVMEFQRRAGLRVDGVVRDELLKVLEY